MYPGQIGMTSIPVQPAVSEHYRSCSPDPNMPVILNTRSLKSEQADMKETHLNDANGEMYEYGEEDDSDVEYRSDGELVAQMDQHMSCHNLANHSSRATGEDLAVLVMEHIGEGQGCRLDNHSLSHSKCDLFMHQLTNGRKRQ
eukprot:g34091.t1